MKRPHCFTPNEDTAILSLFPVMSTEKLSILLNVGSETVIKRYRYLKKQEKKQC